VHKTRVYLVNVNVKGDKGEQKGSWVTVLMHIQGMELSTFWRLALHDEGRADSNSGVSGLGSFLWYCWSPHWRVGIPDSSWLETLFLFFSTSIMCIPFIVLLSFGRIPATSHLFRWTSLAIVSYISSRLFNIKIGHSFIHVIAVSAFGSSSWTWILTYSQPSRLGLIWPLNLTHSLTEKAAVNGGLDCLKFLASSIEST